MQKTHKKYYYLWKESDTDTKRNKFESNNSFRNNNMWSGGDDDTKLKPQVVDRYEKKVSG